NMINEKDLLNINTTEEVFSRDKIPQDGDIDIIQIPQNSDIDIIQ
ncbi:24152_t:CDS:1, partial [Dentiscutata erythropus]